MRKFVIAILCLSFIFTTAGPNSGGTFTTSAGAGNRDWTNVSNVASSNNTYATIALVQTDDISYYIKVTNFGFSIPAATINGIQVEWERHDDSQSFFEDALFSNVEQIVKGGTIGGSNLAGVELWPDAVDAYQSYGGATELWGLSWTIADINASDFGAAGCVFGSGNNLLTTAYVDHCRITVYYTESVSGTKKKIVGYSGHTEVVRVY